MNSQHLKRKRFPDAPGVYFFKQGKQILYIGKATVLRDRVRSYFSRDLSKTRGRQIARMVEKANGLDFRQTDSVLEAILLEADLIKKFQPPYNTLEKDDKSFNCVVITKEDFPRVLTVRKKNLDLSKAAEWYGPFPNGAQLRDAIKIIRKLFPFRDKCLPNQGKPCFNRQIGLCPGVCTGEISKVEYARVIRNIKLFFSGKKKQVLKNLEREMKTAAKIMNFERAQEIKKTIFGLRHIRDVGLVKAPPRIAGRGEKSFRIEAYDIAHISGTDVVGAMVVLENGAPQKSDYRKFKIRGGFGPFGRLRAGNNDPTSLKEMIERRLKHREWPLPELFVADGGLAQKRIIEEALKMAGVSAPVVAVTKNERHRPEKILGGDPLVKIHKQEILLANSEVHRFAISFHRTRRASNFNTRC